ncbi:MAG: hypothetical protein SPL86_01180 [Succiniclasticum sp.]|uniref:hypothetical protein n=1 Tax=Succiniclasticum sp. TaxID=2775030 RepID=UPI002A914990|nr:hypothetical protein [Succiniclasticum sp.]MDY6290079.1 hypothetical protein [Succiniclasticum sp.]
MGENIAEISRENFDGVVDNQLTTIDKLRADNEEKDKVIKKQRQEILNLKKPRSIRFWVKVYKDTDLSFLSFRDKGILFSLCQLIGRNKGGYLEDRNTGGIIETWSQLGRNIGIKDDAHTRNACKKLEENGVLIVEHLRNGSIEDNDSLEHHFRRDKRRAANQVDKRHFRINEKFISIGKEV